MDCTLVWVLRSQVTATLTVAEIPQSSPARRVASLFNLRLRREARAPLAPIFPPLIIFLWRRFTHLVCITVSDEEKAGLFMAGCTLPPPLMQGPENVLRDGGCWRIADQHYIKARLLPALQKR